MKMRDVLWSLSCVSKGNIIHKKIPRRLQGLWAMGSLIYFVSGGVPCPSPAWGDCTDPIMKTSSAGLTGSFSGDCNVACQNCDIYGLLCFCQAKVVNPAGYAYCVTGVQGTSVSCTWDIPACGSGDNQFSLSGTIRGCCSLWGLECAQWYSEGACYNKTNPAQVKGDPVVYNYRTTTPSLLSPGNKKITYNDFDNPAAPGNTDLPNETPTAILYRTIEDGYTADHSGSVLPYHDVTSFAYSTTCPPPNVAGVGEKLTGLTDPRGNTTRFGWTTVWVGSTVACNLTATETPLGQRTDYTNYTPAGDLQQITDPNGLVTLLTYNTNRQVTQMTQQGAGPGGIDVVTTFEYTSGDLTAIQLPKGNVIVYTWGTTVTPHTLLSISRRATRTGPDLEKIAYSYDSAGNRIHEEVRDAAGSLRRFQNYAYDTRNRLSKVFNPTNPAQFIQYGYEDGMNQRTSIVDELGRATSFTYTTVNPPGQTAKPFLKQVQDPLSGVTQYVPDIQGNLGKVTDATSLSTGYQFDDMGRLVQATSPDTGMTRYWYDPNCNLLGKVDARGVRVEYAYDPLNR